MSEVITRHSCPIPLTQLNGGIVSLVEQALLAEARLTPKPGLVDIRNAGAHRDMDILSFERSAIAIAPWMSRFYEMGESTVMMAPEQVLPMIRPLGVACEQDMLRATGGVNTHRGAIFAFGLLSTAIGRLTARGEPLEQSRMCNQVARFCRGIVARELNSRKGEVGRAETLFLRFGFTGARGEAERGFATVRTLAMPAYHRVLSETGDSQLALLQTLLHLMAWNDDTNLVSRGGLEGLSYVQTRSQQLLWEGGVFGPEGLTPLQRFDDDLIARHLSPGGSADLLAVTWFLNHFPPGAL